MKSAVVLALLRKALATTTTLEALQLRRSACIRVPITGSSPKAKRIGYDV